ncbi:hypothetical protein CANCADRAFT_102799 [Tortispora caseinolytica NRRL Y-17796]|uniref:B30.2/SPRY domain-containing protein n=1 Tax=Tortispora caseinolytica NRRL Y-17796 TaxID=767744 RepID=A0A1E4TEM4_9ASCO|nr:hypothetical protein CANCADRAFT_102799 [Tortispora caseinolytica NRRL Y-17796]
MPSAPSLPHRWSTNDIATLVSVSADGLEAKLGIPPPNSKNELEPAAIRTTDPIPPQCGVFYFEITVVAKPPDGCVSLGLSGSKTPLSRLAGCDTDSWGYHGDDGHIYVCQGSGKAYGPSFQTGDTIGLCVNTQSRSAFYTKNGLAFSTAFKDLKDKLYPTVGLKPGEHIAANFGFGKPFLYDINAYVQNCKTILYKQMASLERSFKPPSSGITPEVFSNAMVESLVYSYLVHEGYGDSAHEFAKELKVIGAHTEEETDNAHNHHRQKIRAAVLSGNIDRAISLTNLFYPNLLTQNPNVKLQLELRRFIEIIRFLALRGSDTSSADANSAAANGGSSGINGNGKDVEEDLFKTLSAMGNDEILLHAIEYGREIEAEFGQDSQARSHLEQTFAIMTYQDPLNSVLAPMLDPAGRAEVAEELNSSIMMSLGKSKVSPLKTVVQIAKLASLLLASAGPSGFLANIDSDVFAPICSEQYEEEDREEH